MNKTYLGKIHKEGKQKILDIQLEKNNHTETDIEI